MADSPRGLRRAPSKLRRLTRIAGLLLGLWLLWLAPVNALLALHAIPRYINAHNPVVTLDYGSAWTLWPGTVHLRDFRLRARDGRTLELSFQLERVYAVISLPALRSRTFRATRVEAEGVEARFRFPFQPGERRRALAQAPLLPPIAGFEDPPMVRLGPEAPPGAPHRFWKVDLEDVHLAHLRQLWVQAYRLQLDGAVTGRFALEPTRRFELGPAQLDLAGGRLTLGERQVAVALAGRATCVVHPLPLPEVHDLDFFHFIDGALKVSGQIPDLGFVGRALPGLAFSGGAGPVSLELGIARGVLTPATHLRFDAAPIQVESRRLRVSGALQLDAHVEEADGSTRGVATLHLKPVALAQRGTPQATIEAPEAKLVARWDHPVDLAAPLASAGFQLDVDALSLPLEPWLRTLPPAVRVASGRARGALHLGFQAPSERGHGSLHLQTSGLSARLAHRLIRGEAEVNLAIDRLDLRAKTLELAGSDLSWVTTAAPSGTRDAPRWWLKAELDRASLDLRGSPGFTAAARAQARDGRPIVELLAAMGKLPRALNAALSLSNLKARAEARLRDGALTLSPVRVVAGSTEVLGTARLTRTLDGVVLVRSGPVSIGAVITRDALQIQWLHAEDLFKRALDANGVAERGPGAR